MWNTQSRSVRVHELSQKFCQQPFYSKSGENWKVVMGSEDMVPSRTISPSRRTFEFYTDNNFCTSLFKCFELEKRSGGGGFWASRLLACVSAHSRRTDPDRDSVQRPSLWAGSSFIASSDARSTNFLITLRSAARSASSARNQTERSDYNAITKGWNTRQANKEYCPHVRQNLEDCKEPLTWPGSDQSAVSVQFSAEGEEEPKNSGVMNKCKCSLNVNIWTEF